MEQKPKVLTPEEFNLLPLMEKRVLVAEDVIAQIYAQVYNTDFRCYVDVRPKDRHIDSFDLKHESARDLLLENKLQCTVCARGALFLSALKFKNKLTFIEAKEASFYYREEVENNEDASESYIKSKTTGTNFMGDLFSEEEQSRIEVVFEDDTEHALASIAGEEDYLIDYRGKLTDEYLHYSEENSEVKTLSEKEFVLVRIMENIIKNKGKFIIN